MAENTEPSITPVDQQESESAEIEHHNLGIQGYQNDNASESDANKATKSQNDESDVNVHEATNYKSQHKLRKTFKFLFGVALFSLVLVCTVFSKLTLVSLTDRLRSATVLHFNKTLENNEMALIQDYDIAVSLYWQLLIIVLIPNIISCLRSLVFGVLGKTTINFPWPTRGALILGIGASIIEVFAVSVFIFLVMAELPPDISLFLLNGIFFCQSLVDVIGSLQRVKKKGNQYETISSEDKSKSSASKNRLLIICSIIVKLSALILQISSLVIFIFLWSFRYMTFEVTGLEHLYRLRPMIALPCCLLVFSFIWTNKFQEWTHASNPAQENQRKTKDQPRLAGRTTRYKSCFINSLIRIFLYPFVTYIIFRYATFHQIDPWCLDNCDYGIQFTGETWIVFTVQLLTTFFGYIFAWIACTMTLGVFMGSALFTATPISAAAYYVHTYGNLTNAHFFPPFTNLAPIFDNAYPWAPVILGLLWVGQVLIMGYYICLKKTTKILAKDWDLFLIPYYDSVFFEQQMLLNRQTKKTTPKAIFTFRTEFHIENDKLKGKKGIFICTPMYRENAHEMKQTLMSIKHIAGYYQACHSKNPNFQDIYEAHIFFDGALVGAQFQKFGLQLLSLLDDTLGVYPEETIQNNKTPYGVRLVYKINGIMPFFIHFKDKSLVKPKKRWSQVMYMKYIIKYRIEGQYRTENETHQTEPADKLLLGNTFIITTDADVKFTPKSAHVLLDMLNSNPLVGAVCARTHPLGSGPLYWYQVFDYAVGHWFQKPAEHLLGCVLCSPGCFSAFRCSALEQVLEEYSSETTNGMEFLMKDMGEDRWLCTLLIQKGWRLEYCAVSEDSTHCPTEFGEFYNQRRRWTASTIANLWLLISGIRKISRNNDSVSVLFILFQALILFSTVISPATVILVIASGLQSAYKLSDGLVFFIIVLLVTVSVLYGAVCLFASPKTKIDVSKILTMFFAIVMIIVIAGIFKSIIASIFPEPKPTLLTAPNCTHISVGNYSKAREKCEDAARYLASLPNELTTYHSFRFPVSTSVLYLGLFTLTFLLAAILHPTEFFSLFHSFWYLLALPSGYLLLIIYSIANLDSQSWGTREKSDEEDKGLLGILKYPKMLWKMLLLCCPCKNLDQSENIRNEVQSATVTIARQAPVKELKPPEMTEAGKRWLKEHYCDEDYIALFERNGYTDEKFFAEMTLKDFEEIGIDKLGVRLHLAKAVKTLSPLSLDTNVPDSVRDWIEALKMPEDYKDLFEYEGFIGGKDDMENLKSLTKQNLKDMGITRRAHLQRLTSALHLLVHPNEVDRKVSVTKAMIKKTKEKVAEDSEKAKSLKFEQVEKEFWDNFCKNELDPIPPQLTSVNEVKKSLRRLRNSSLTALFLVNIMWIIVLFTVEFRQLALYGFDPRVFQLLFLSVYSIIIVVQFIAMVCHRGITLVHYFGRVPLKDTRDNHTAS